MHTTGAGIPKLYMICLVVFAAARPAGVARQEQACQL